MGRALIAVLAALVVKSVFGLNNDLFNYKMDSLTEPGGQSFGQPFWNEVTCTDPKSCVSEWVQKGTIPYWK